MGRLTAGKLLDNAYLWFIYIFRCIHDRYNTLLSDKQRRVIPQPQKHSRPWYSRPLALKIAGSNFKMRTRQPDGFLPLNLEKQSSSLLSFEIKVFQRENKGVGLRDRNSHTENWWSYGFYICHKQKIDVQCVCEEENLEKIRKCWHGAGWTDEKNLCLCDCIATQTCILGYEDIQRSHIFYNVNFQNTCELRRPATCMLRWTSCSQTV